MDPTEQPIQFHILSFEGPDSYAQAGGLASRVNGLTEALASAGFETHLWFVGDPALPGHDIWKQVKLHRWCQWISRFHPCGVYDGEEGKRADFAHSLPLFLFQEILSPYLKTTDGQVVILAEEWQTADAVLHLDWLLRNAGLRQRVCLFWNANNTFGFERINWKRLTEAAIITTVSRYMRYRMWEWGVDPLVIPNGLPAHAFQSPKRSAVAEFRHRLAGRVVLGKVARWDPDKRWFLAVDIVGELKRQGWRPLLIVRGGMEAHGGEVFAKAASTGLQITDRKSTRGGVYGLLECLDKVQESDIVNLNFHLDVEAKSVLFRGADAILANSGHEPFGLVGLETMAVGGIACTGCTGEDYAVHGWNALVLQTNDPEEFVNLFHQMHEHPAEMRALRQRGKLTAKQYAWHTIIQRNLFPRIAFRNVSSPLKSSQMPYRLEQRKRKPSPSFSFEGFSPPVTRSKRGSVHRSEKWLSAQALPLRTC